MKINLTKLTGVGLFLALVSLSLAVEKSGKPTMVAPGIHETNAQIMRRATLKPWDGKIRENKRTEIEGPDRSNLPQNPLSPVSSRFPISLNEVGDLIRPLSKGQIIGPRFSQQFGINGPTVAEGQAVPPDTCGDVSPTQVVFGVNSFLRSTDKNGANQVLNLNIATFFNSVRNGSGLSDPRVIFDRLTQRWFIAAINLASDNRILLAVSDNATISLNSASGWTFYQFQQSVGGGGAAFADYPTLGVDANAVYIGTNQFNTALNTFLGCNMYVVRKSTVLTPGAPVVTRMVVLSSTVPGPFTPQPCSNDDPSSTVGFAVGVSSGVKGRLTATRINDPAGSPTFTSFNITVPATLNPFNSPTPNGTLDALDDRLFQARTFLNKTTGIRNVWAAHNVGVNANGASASATRTGSRFYEIANAYSGTPLLVQSATVFESSATPLFYSIPAIAMNLQGHAFMGGSLANSTTNPGISGAFRLNTDPVGTITAPTVLQAGLANYTTESGNGRRWGDYSTSVVDPSDGMSVWTFQMFSNAAGQWQVRAVKMRSLAPSISGISPSNAVQGTTLNVTVTGTGLFDTDATYPGRLTAAFGANITVNSVTWVSATQATVNITVGTSAATGSRSVSLTNPDGQAATANLIVDAPVITVSGTLNLEGYVGPVGNLQFSFQFFDANTNALLDTQNISGLGTGSAFAFNTPVAPGTYRLRIKGNNRFLGKSQLITLTSPSVSGLSYSLKNGDCDGNNSVSTGDFSILRAAFGSIPSSGNWNANADLNGDGSVSTADLNILRANFGLLGDN
jgi:hypothetical protein